MKYETNTAVRAMLKRAGFYLISSDGFIKTYSVVEVEPDGTCHQLTPALQRDGVLRATRWAPGVHVKGPYATAADAENQQILEWYRVLYQDDHDKRSTQ